MIIEINDIEYEIDNTGIILSERINPKKVFTPNLNFDIQYDDYPCAKKDLSPNKEF